MHWLPLENLSLHSQSETTVALFSESVAVLGPETAEDGEVAKRKAIR
jgi:hypothetical protein